MDRWMINILSLIQVSVLYFGPAQFLGSNSLGNCLAVVSCGLAAVAKVAYFGRRDALTVLAGIAGLMTIAISIAHYVHRT